MRYKKYTFLKKALHNPIVAAGLLAIVLTGGCGDAAEGDDSFSEGIPTEVTFTLSSRYNGMQTRADGTAVDPNSDNERIGGWWMVFVDKNKIVRKILHRTDIETGIASDASAVEEETFKCILPSGTYDVYAFANIDEEMLKKAAPSATFTVGETISDGFDNATWTASAEAAATELNLFDITSASIPMTGFLHQIKVRNTIEETFSIEVVRMTAKIEMRFINPGNEKVTVTKVALYPMTEGSVSLFPRNESGIGYGHLGNYSYSPLGGATYKTLEYSPTGGLEVNPPTESQEYTKDVFYTKETYSGGDGPFTITLGLKYADNSEQTLRLKPTQKIKGYINRNDWIVIPVKLSQYVITTSGIFYPPIGGYPAMDHTSADDGSDVYTLGTWGEFSIFPEFIDQLSGNNMDPNRYIMTIEDMTGDVSIFKTQPSLTSKGGKLEIFGEVGTTTGTATLNIVVRVYDSENPVYDSENPTDNDEPKHTYTHKVIIKRS